MDGNFLQGLERTFWWMFAFALVGGIALGVVGVYLVIQCLHHLRWV